MKRYAIAEARDHFTSVVREVEQESAIELTRRGEVVAVLLSKQEYQRLSSRKKTFWEAYTDFRADYVNFQDIQIEDWRE